MDGEINLVIGARDGSVYYYSTKGVTGKISYQEFMK
jgi:tryptophan synthase alpha subunit